MPNDTREEMTITAEDIGTINADDLLGGGPTKIEELRDKLNALFTMAHGNGAVFVYAAANNLVRDIAWLEAKNLAPRPFRAFESAHRIELESGPVVYILSMDEPEKLRGLAITAFWCDELVSEEQTSQLFAQQLVTTTTEDGPDITETVQQSRDANTPEDDPMDFRTWVGLVMVHPPSTSHAFIAQKHIGAAMAWRALRALKLQATKYNDIQMSIILPNSSRICVKTRGDKLKGLQFDSVYIDQIIPPDEARELLALHVKPPVTQKEPVKPPSLLPGWKRYQCYKQVNAAKITSISDGDIFVDDAVYTPQLVPEGFFEKHNPQVGGYLVVYGDDYMSFSPAEAFEEGYNEL